ncbi:MAG: hypothetical protein GX661_02610, partial [Acholeplasmataceae bacterium]|nr:hypothetical protein [Acholeplasmataceae bacterium]
MKEIRSEQLDNETAAKTQKKSPQEKAVKKPAATKTDRPSAMDALEKVRAEEKAKLEALKAREREKTRLAVEKERARLEAELAKEINALESQLAKERSQQVNVETTPARIEFVEVETAPVKPSVTAKTAVAKTAAAKTAKVKPAVKKAVAKKAKPEPKVAAKAAVTEAKKAKPKRTVKPKPVVETIVGPIELQPFAEETAMPAPVLAGSENMAEAPVEMPAIPEEQVTAPASESAVTETPVDTPAVSEEPLVASENDMPTTEESATPAVGSEMIMEVPVAIEIQDSTIQTQESDVMKQDVIKDLEMPVTEDAPQENGVDTEPVAEAQTETAPMAEMEDLTALENADDEPRTVINSLEKLREKIYAQKQLERELLEKEASKIQEKDKQLLKKLTSFPAEDIRAAEMEDLKQARAQIESLITENDNQLRRLNELENIVNKVKTLKINNIEIIDDKTFEISNDFIRLTKDKIDVNSAVLDIERELDSLTKAHEDTIRKLRESEASHQELEKTYSNKLAQLAKDSENYKAEISNLRNEISRKENIYQEALRNMGILNQEKLSLEQKISNLNQVILRSEEKINEEKDNNQAYLVKIETLEANRRKMENEISGLNAEIYMLNEKLNKRLQASVNTAARIDALEAEKAVLEAKIVQLSKQMVMKNNIYRQSEYPDNDLNRIISEIERLKREVQRIAGQPFEDPLDYPRQEQNIPYLEKAETSCPYHRFFNPAMIPNTEKTPQVLNNDLAEEIAKLRNEFQELKQVKETPKINEVDVDALKVEQAKELQNLQSELDKSKEELKTLTEEKEKELAELSESFKMQLQAKDNEKEMLKVETSQKIQELEKLIAEKDAIIQKINDELKRLNEDDIFDPEFKRKIRVIRDMKREAEEKAAKEEQNYQNNSKALKEKIDAKTVEIDLINDKLFQLELNYKQNRDFSSAAQEEYEKTKSKFMIERQLQEERRHDLEDDLTRLNFKYQSYLNTKDAEIEKLNVEESQIIDYYLNKLRHSKSKELLKLQETENEKEELVNQLEEMKSEEEIETSEESSQPESEDYIGNNYETLQNEIRELTRQYNEYYRQITELKAEQDKRIEVEKQLRSKEKVVYDYCTGKINLDECLKTYQEKSKLIEDKQEELAKTSSNPEDRTAQLKLKAEIQDLDVHRNDLRAKIDFYRKQLSELEKQEIVQNYKSLIMQMEKIRAIQREKREQAEAIKVQ